MPLWDTVLKLSIVVVFSEAAFRSGVMGAVYITLDKSPHCLNPAQACDLCQLSGGGISLQQHTCC